MYTEFRRSIINFFKKHGRKIIIVLIIWIIILVINYFVGKMEPELKIDTNYRPHKPIMGDESVPEKLQTPIEQLIGSFIEKCNNKDYDGTINQKTIDFLLGFKTMHDLVGCSNSSNTNCIY